MSHSIGPAEGARIPVVEIIVSEEFDIGAIPRLDALLDDALALRPRELVVNLAGCPFLDASAIGLLVDVHRRARRVGSELTLRTVSERLQRNLKLARVDRVLRVLPTGAPTDSGPNGSDRPGENE